MATYRFSNYVGALLLLISIPLHFVTTALFPVFRSAWDLAFPVEAAAEKIRVPAFATASVIYGASLARTRAFLERVSARMHDRQGFGVLGLQPAN